MPTVDNIPNSTSTTYSIQTNGSSGYGIIDFNGDTDWWQISLSAGTTYSFRLNGAAVSSTPACSDPYLRLMSSSGSQITANDDGGGNLNSLITYTPSSSGTYYLSAEGFANARTGGYAIFATANTSSTPPPPSNTAPVVSSQIPDQSWTEGQSGSYVVPSSTFSDANGDTLTYTATQSNGSTLPSWLSFSPTSRTFAGTVPAGTPDVTLRVTAADGRGGSIYDDFNLATPAGNNAPTLASSMANQAWTEGQAGSFVLPSGTFSDADGDTLSYAATQTNGSALPSWLSFSASTRTFAGTVPTGSADFAIRVTASDGRGGSIFGDFNLTTPAPVATGRAPTVVRPSPLEDQYLMVGERLAYVLPATTFTDPDGDPLTFSVRNTPSWMSFDASTRTLSGTPTADGDFTLTITGQDPGGLNASTSLDVFVDVEEENNAPVLDTPIPDFNWREGRMVRFVIPRTSFSDPDGDTLTYSAQGRGGRSLPSWLTFNASSRTFRGRAPINSPDLAVRITVADPEGLRVSDEVTFRTTNSSAKPVAGFLSFAQDGAGATPLALGNTPWNNDSLCLAIS